MSITDILFNAASGGIVGSLLHLVTSYAETKQKIALMNAQVAAAEKEAAWNAFAKSQEGSNTSLTIPANVPPWVASFYVCVDGLKQLTRPLLTWSAVIIITMVYLRASDQTRAEITPQILFGSFTAVFWWFGARYNKESK